MEEENVILENEEIESLDNIHFSFIFILLMIANRWLVAIKQLSFRTSQHLIGNQERI